MKLNTLVNQLQHEAKVVQGEATRDMTYSSHTTFPDELAAHDAFARSVAKLLNVNGWSGLSSITADFTLYDSTGREKPDGPVQEGDYIQIRLPGPMPENWVRVIHMTTTDQRVEFTVQPSADPGANNPTQVEHFFHEQARSTFRVERQGTTLTASEIGQEEAINNQQPQAGDRAIVNTVIAEGGWLFYQKIQWKLLTNYLVHL